MANLQIVQGAGFPGEFAVTPAGGYTPTTTEQAYIDALARAMERMQRDIGQDPAGTDADAVARANLRRERRAQALKEIADEAAQVVAGKLVPELATDNAFVIRGEYLSDLKRIGSLLFVVEPVLKNGHVDDVQILVADKVVASQDPAAQEKQALYVALDNARTVVSTVARRMEDRATQGGGTNMQEWDKARDLRNRYMGKLVEIGRLGLQGPHADLGKLALNGFRADFVAQEAGRVKNQYVRSLGTAAGIAALLFVLAYALISNCAEPASFWNQHKLFLLAAAGAALGTWLSFSIRRVTLGFDDLAVLEEDRLDPGVRVIFVVMLTLLVFLLFWTGAMNIEIGALKTGALKDQTSTLPLGAIALLVGAFCGIAERALATAVSGRATAFVGTLGA